MIKTKALLILFLTIFFHPTVAHSIQWQSIRDGSFKVLPQTDDILNIEWSPAWLNEANAEEIYLINNNGELVEKIKIPKDSDTGKRSINIHKAFSPYKLVIPGYSFRNYKVIHSAQTISLFEPNKLHASVDIPNQAVTFFKSAKNSKTYFSGKYYSGANKIILERLSDKFTTSLDLISHEKYEEYNSKLLPVSNTDEIWKVSFNRSGKVAFWLDGSENLFSLSADNLNAVLEPEAYTEILLTDEIVGLSPDIGVALPYFFPPSYSHSIIDSLNLKSASFYSFVDVIYKEPNRESEFRKLYLDKFDIKNSITLLAGSQRKAVLEADTEALNGLTKWTEDSLLLGNNANHYIAFADEPNLNFNSYEEFSNYFELMLAHLKSRPKIFQSGIKVAVPASSRFIDGPFRTSSHTRLGIDWAQRLLDQHSEDIQAIAWHEWMNRNLYATRRYQDSIQAAAELVGLDKNGRPKKALLIDQTNISSGNSTSPYEQDTHFAALWWASVIINSSQNGLLEMLNWFHLADEPDHMKGLIAVSNDGQISLKPVAKAHIFLTENWLKHVKKLENSSFEVDVLHTQEQDDQQLIGVNKSTRNHQMTIKLNAACPSSLHIKILDTSSNVHTAASSCVDNTLHFMLPEQSIFRAEWKKQK